MIPVAAQAQQITSGVEGRVTDDSSAPVAGASIVVTDTRTGVQRTATTGAEGNFRVAGLVPGGPYTVATLADGYEGQSVENVFVTLQGNTSFDFTLSGGGGEIVVTAQRANLTQLAIGPGQTFGQDTLENFASVNRDIRDYIKIDPRVSLDRSDEVDRISCLGGNDRSNTFTVDGITQADVFGLNYTPFASRNSLPLPFDAVRETSVEFAPFDVEYGAFTGCAINVVTKSGSNKFHGSAFFTYRDNNLRGDTIAGQPFVPAKFKEKRYGATLGGPIIKDKLFFFGAYEKLETGSTADRGPIGGGYANTLDFIDTAQFNELSDVIQNVYGIETGPMARSLPQGNERYFGRLDWYINDQHRLEGTYQHLDEVKTEEDDISNTNYAGLNTYEEEGTTSDYYSLRLYSNWTDNFSTEVRASRAVVQDIQGPVGGGEAQTGNPIPRIIVGVQNGGNIGTFQAGPGYSRTSNDLRTEIDQIKVKGQYNAGQHTLTVGAEANQLHVFNLFAQNSTGTLTFANINDLRAGLLTPGSDTFPTADEVYNGVAAGAYGNFTASGDINDAAAEWTRTIFSVYAQDEWQATPNLKLLGGIRVDWYDGDAPKANPNFQQRYGFSNAIPFSKFDPVVMPRLGFTYDLGGSGFLSRSRLTGGVGSFTGGDPAVYMSNGFSNNGYPVGFGSSTTSGCNAFEDANGQIDVTPSGTFTGFPQCVVAAGSAQSAAGLADTQSTDPNFKVPVVWRANLGYSTNFGTASGLFSNWHLNVDYIYSHFVNPANFVDLSQVVDTRLGAGGYTVDGRPIYRAIDPTRPGCTATLLNQGGTPPTYSGVNAACFGTSRDDEIQLTNGKSYNSHVASILLAKTFAGGIFTPGGKTSINLGYAWTKANNNRNNASSTATSSFDIVAAFDRQNPAVARSEYESRHNITAAVNFREKFFGDYATSAGFTFVARSGRPYSLTFDASGVFNDSASGNYNALLYIPKGPTDPNLSPTSDPVAVQKLIDYTQALGCADGYEGRTIARNTCHNDWTYDVDLRFSQEIPGPGRLLGVNDKLKLYADFDNFLNLLDSNWNVSRKRSYTVDVARGNFDNQGRYVITNFDPYDVNQIQTSSSIWKVQFGISYEF